MHPRSSPAIFTAADFAANFATDSAADFAADFAADSFAPATARQASSWPRAVANQGNAAEGAAALDMLLARQKVWRAGRAPLAATCGEPTGFAALDALLPQAGWPCAAVTELLLSHPGVGELSLLMPTLARLTTQGGTVVLIAPPYLPYAPAWRAAGVDLSRLYLVEANPRDALWAFEQCLRSAACAAVLGWPMHAEVQVLRRLQVAAGSGDCLGFVFRERKHADNPSPAALRLECVRAASGSARGYAWQVRKCRGGYPSAVTFAITH